MRIFRINQHFCLAHFFESDRSLSIDREIVGAAGAATPFLGRDAITPKKVWQRTQYAVNFFLTGWLTYLLTYLLRSLFFAATSSRSANSHIFGLLGNCPPCLIGSDNSYHFCEKLLSYHKRFFPSTTYSFFIYSYN